MIIHINFSAKGGSLGEGGASQSPPPPPPPPKSAPDLPPVLGCIMQLATTINVVPLFHLWMVVSFQAVLKMWFLPLPYSPCNRFSKSLTLACMHTFPDTQGQPYHEEPDINKQMLEVPNNMCPHVTSVYSSPNQYTSMTTSITTYTQQEDYTSYALTGMETTSVNSSGSSQAPGDTSNYTQYTPSQIITYYLQLCSRMSNASQQKIFSV